MKLAKSLVVVALLLLPLTTLHAQLLDKKVLTLEAADKIAAAAETAAKKETQPSLSSSWTTAGIRWC